MEPKWNQNGTKMEPKWNQNGTKMEPKWNQNGTKMEPKWDERTGGMPLARICESEVRWKHEKHFFFR
jgi:hypothetical protein